MNIAIIQFPGSNCERETMLAVKRAGMLPVEFLWNAPVEKLATYDGFVLVGGFSYEDRSRAGIIAALDPVMQVLNVQSQLGKPILGICNGAQILVEAGLVPGLDQHLVDMALTDNKRIKQGSVLGTGYYNAWINLTLSKTHRRSAFTRHLTAKSVLNIPVAHAEGRFMIPPALLDIIETNGLSVFKYCTEKGDIVDEFPVNPNGSVNNIAAIANASGNVLAMMPHPERTQSGDAIFLSMRDYIAAGDVLKADVIAYTPKPIEIKNYVKANLSDELVVELLITDNHAMSVESALRKNGIFVSIKRQIHWEIKSTSQRVLQKIEASGLLYNSRKERVITVQTNSSSQQTVLVRAKEDMLGRHMMQQLKQHHGIDGVELIQHGVIWQISADSTVLDSALEHIMATRILFNPASHECFHYA